MDEDERRYLQENYIKELRASGKYTDAYIREVEEWHKEGREEREERERQRKKNS